MTWEARGKRINGNGNAVFDIYREAGRFFVATVEVRDTAPGGMKVLMGAMQPAGKVRAWEAIDRVAICEKAEAARTAQFWAQDAKP